MTARVVHCKREQYDVYIGRPSIWGNQFRLLKESERDESIRRYRGWIMEPEQEWLRKRLPELRGKVLGCWCAPRACHGDVLLELANKEQAMTKPIQKIQQIQVGAIATQLRAYHNDVCRVCLFEECTDAFCMAARAELAAHERLRDAVQELVDTFWPADIVDGSSGDIGALLVCKVREALRACLPPKGEGS